MGMVQSGSVSDTTLYASLERDFILKEGNVAKYSILYYARFRDDIILIVDSPIDTIRELLREMREKARPFVITLDAISRHGFQMLDVEACVTRDSGLSFRLYKKPSSIWKPLSPESLHPKSVHVHWPLAQCDRILRRHTNAKEEVASVSHFKTLYSRLFGIPIAEKHKSFRPQQVSSWIVLPYNVCLVGVRLSQVVSSLSVPIGLSFSRVRLAWSLNSKHLVHRLRRP